MVSLLIIIIVLLFFFYVVIFFFIVGFYLDVFLYFFDEKFDNFVFNCLLIREEVIVVMVKVRFECNKVVSMFVFQVLVLKSMKFEEFEQI